MSYSSIKPQLWSTQYSSKKNVEPDQRLRYRRQFLLSRAPIATLNDWRSLRVDQYYLYSHPDLEVNKLSDVKKTIVLVGYLFDSVEYKKGNSDILGDIMTKSKSFQDFILAIKQYAGRYVFIYQDETCLKVVQDPLSSRELYYCTGRNLIICGSQPNLISTYSSPELGITQNSEITDFFENDMKSVRNRCLWAGDGTYYEGIKHLLPNHCLDLGSLSVQRYWPNSKLTTLNLEVTVNRTCSFLQGIMRAVTWRQPVMMAVTAGTDSRTLLAASREVTDKIYFFINKEKNLNDKWRDIRVPRKIFSRLNVPFHVHDVPADVDAGFKEVFLSNTFFSSERILPTIFNVYFRNQSEKMNILGLGEIGRARLGNEPKKLNAYYLAYAMGYKKSKYAVKQCQQWLREALPAAREYGVDIMTLLYWEQVFGNWGAVGNSESDIAMEEFNPYDSHYVYETLLSVDEKSIKGNRRLIFVEILRQMWPELLEYPMNPPDNMRERVADLLKRIGIHPVLKKLRYQADYLRYAHLCGGM